MPPRTGRGLGLRGGGKHRSRSSSHRFRGRPQRLTRRGRQRQAHGPVDGRRGSAHRTRRLVLLHGLVAAFEAAVVVARERGGAASQRVAVTCK
jgi:hypothetical protein